MTKRKMFAIIGAIAKRKMSVYVNFEGTFYNGGTIMVKKKKI